MCKMKKPIKDFYPSKQYINRGFQYRCIKCSKRRCLDYHYSHRDTLLKKWKVTRDNLTNEQKDDIKVKSREYAKINLKKRLLWRAKDRSRRLGMYCDITSEDIIIPLKCPLLETPFIFGAKHDKWFTYSLDRIDNSKGYVKGNIQVISYLANTMKSQATMEQLKTFAKNILKLLKDDDIV